MATPSFNYANAFSPSFKSNTFVTEIGEGIDFKSEALNLDNIDFSKVRSVRFDPIAFTSPSFISPGWKFITAPEDISWDVSNQATRADIFGTNGPPVVAGSRGMRDLTLGNSLVEGFIRGVTVEGKIAALENLMNYTLNAKDGFVGVPVYQVTANNKVYGNGYFIIKDVRVKETMRDTRGDATRAYVDISLMEVPKYQVNSGRDLASQPAAAARSFLPDRVVDPNGVGATKPTAGPGVGKATTATPANQGGGGSGGGTTGGGGGTLGRQNLRSVGPPQQQP